MPTTEDHPMPADRYLPLWVGILLSAALPVVLAGLAVHWSTP